LRLIYIRLKVGKKYKKGYKMQETPSPEERQVEVEKNRALWQRECFQRAQKHLAEKGIMPQSVIEKESRFLAPICAMWKIKAQNGKTYWVITGKLPTDHAQASMAATARDAIRYFSLQWQLKADQIMQVGAKDNTQIDFANLLIKRAHGLYEIYENETLWSNEAK
jgi:hypothetical protein